MKRALITGIAGQDGSYLAELLLSKGYEVHGLVRRASSFNRHRIDHLPHDTRESDCCLFLHYGDLSDAVGLVNLIREIVPDEVYHLGAQSHVHVSFEIPDYTGQVTGLGTVRLLEAIHASGIETRFYQASSSEMFGAAPAPQSEDTPFHPRSPYACAKVYAHHATVNYREAYDLFAVSGILFNHESLPTGTPVVVRRNGYIDVAPIDELVPHPDDPSEGTVHTAEGGDLEVWDGEQWVACTARTATWRDEAVYRVQGRGGIVSTSGDHVIFMERGEKAAKDVAEGDRVRLARQPWSSFQTVLTRQEAWLLGCLAAEGYVGLKGNAKVVCRDEAYLAEAAACWEAVGGGSTNKTSVVSGFGGDPTPAVDLSGNRPYLRHLRAELYTRAGKKRVPMRILNAAPELQLEFLDAYNQGDGLKAGHGVDPFKSFRTNSAVLATGLVWLARTTLGRRVSMYWQPGKLGHGSYLINLNSGLTPGNKGAHLRRPQEEVRRVDVEPYRGWMFDLATETGRFAAGVGLVVVHNSPRRGENFVTRKITRAVSRIKAGLQEALYLGNLDAKRDWGYAPEYVEGMWLMLQQDAPDDFVLATGETHTIREFAETAFAHAGLDWQGHVRTDPRYERPSEVDVLCGDASKAKRVLGWEAEVKFAELARIMVDADVQLLEDELAGRAVRVD